MKATLTSQVWRSRLGLFAVLGALIVVNVAVLISYRGFYDSKVVALQATQQSLEQRKAELQTTLSKIGGTEERLVSLRDELSTFYADTLGLRKERLAALIGEVYALTRKAGMRPDDIGYSEDAGGVIGMSFAINGKYIDVKRLLAAFETSPHFFVLEGLTVAADDADPDGLKVTVTVTHNFQTQSSRVPKGRPKASGRRTVVVPATAVGRGPAAAPKGQPR